MFLAFHLKKISFPFQNINTNKPEHYISFDRNGHIYLSTTGRNRNAVLNKRDALAN